VVTVGEQLSDSIFQCSWEEAPAWSVLPVPKPKAPIVVIPFPPKKDEVELWKSLPATMSSANHLLGYSSRTERYVSVVTGNMWQIPAEHKRQNRRYCTDLSRKVSRDHSTMGLDLYKSNRSVVKSSTYYVAQMHDVAIQEQGVVALHCGERGSGIGYYQPVASCETFYRFIGKRFVGNCHKNLTSHGVSFAQMMKDTERHGSTCFPQQVLDPGWLNKRKKKDKAGNLLPPRPRIARDIRLVMHDKVFMATAGWDHNYHHFIIDSLTRIVRHIDWLRANPDVKIHMRYFENDMKNEKMIASGRLLRSKFWDLLEIDQSRLIFGPAAARTVWVPRESKCNNPLEMAYEVRLLAGLLKRAAQARLKKARAEGKIPIPPGQKSGLRRHLATTDGADGADGAGIKQKQKQKQKQRRKRARKSRNALIEDDYIDDDGLQRRRVNPARSYRKIYQKIDFGGLDEGDGGAETDTAEEIPPVLLQALESSRPIVLVQQRYCANREDCDRTWREWNDTMTDTVLGAFRETFPGHLVLKASDNDGPLKRCVWCQIALYQRASVLVGIHGAGLTNLMFMAPGTVLVELTGEFDGRMTPVCGYHGPLAAAFGVHHYLWLWVWKITMRHPPRYPRADEFQGLAGEVRQFISTLQS
jgi:hypothetical protein